MTTEQTLAEALQRSEPDPERDRRALVMLLRQYREAQREIDDQQAWMQSITAVFNDEQGTRILTRDRLTEAIEELAKELKPADSQHVDIPGIARIAFRTTAEYLRVADPAAFIAWAKESERGELVIEKVTESVDTAAAKEIAAEARAETGEILPGVEVVPEKVTMKIEGRSK